MSVVPESVIKALQDQLTHELFAANAYLAMSYWCDVQHYGGFARFFAHQTEEEREHADKILRHLADRDVIPAIGALAAPRIDFKSLTDVARLAYDLERENTRGIHACYTAALAEKDYPAQVLLHWFIAEQVEEEAWSDKMLVKVERASCAGAMQYLDHHIEKELAGPEEEDE